MKYPRSMHYATVLPDQTIRHTIFPAGLLALDSAGTTLFTSTPQPQNASATLG